MSSPLLSRASGRPVQRRAIRRDVITTGRPCAPIRRRRSSPRVRRRCSSSRTRRPAPCTLSRRRRDVVGRGGSFKDVKPRVRERGHAQRRAVRRDVIVDDHARSPARCLDRLPLALRPFLPHSRAEGATCGGGTTRPRQVVKNARAWGRPCATSRRRRDVNIAGRTYAQGCAGSWLLLIHLAPPWEHCRAEGATCGGGARRIFDLDLHAQTRSCSTSRRTARRDYR